MVNDDRGITRRDFLTAAALAAASGQAARLAASQPGTTPPIPPDVVQVTSDHVVRGRTVNKLILAEMLDLALVRATGAASPGKAWQSLLRADDVIGLKFNRSGAGGLGVTRPFADAVITSLLAAGFDRKQIVPIETPELVYREHGVVKPARGWASQPVDFGSGSDQLRAVLDQVTAIINIPFLKTHNIAGITCSLKNLSHGLVKHPARFHGSHCSPYIADIVALPLIRDKLRLHLVNGLRIVFDRGPEARHEYTWDAGIIVASSDPVATDTFGLDIIDSQRSILGLEAVNRRVLRTAYLAAAAKRGLGRGNLYRIELAKIRV